VSYLTPATLSDNLLYGWGGHLEQSHSKRGASRREVGDGKMNAWKEVGITVSYETMLSPNGVHIAEDPSLKGESNWGGY